MPELRHRDRIRRGGEIGHGKGADPSAGGRGVLDPAGLAFSSTNNRITTTGYSYDASGNLTQDSSNPTVHTYQWDAESRASSVDNGSTHSFVYNALGHRVHFGISGGGEDHYFDPEGGWLGVANAYDVVRWADSYMTVYAGTSTYFNHVNNIGSTSIVTNHSGMPVEDMLFYPWGHEWQSWGEGGYNFAKLPYRNLSTNTDITTARGWRRHGLLCLRPLAISRPLGG